MYLMG